MSTKCLFLACKAKVGNPLCKLVLIALADIANEADQCWPSHEYIADRAECSPRSVKRYIKVLEAAGHITVRPRFINREQTSNLYTVHPSNGGVTECHPVVTQCHGGGDSVSLGGSDTVAYNTPTLFILPIDTPSTPEARFEFFYARYPKQVGKSEALKAWQKLNPSPDLTAQLIGDCQQRVDKGAWCIRQGKAYIPSPAAYLKGKKWLDEIIPRPEFPPLIDSLDMTQWSGEFPT